MRGAGLSAAAILVLLSAGAAQAVCPGLDVLLEDDFEQLAPGWGEADEELTVNSGSLVVAPGSGTDYWRAHNGGLYDDIDLCVNVSALQSVDPTESRAGAVFWYEDANNFYVFQIAPNQMASVWRRQRGKWLEQVGWRRSDVANEGDGSVNELRVTTRGKDAAFFVNGAAFAEIEGAPPERGQQIGVFASSPAAGRAIFAFDSLRMTRP